MNQEELKNLIHDFVAKHQIGVLATTTPEGNPEAAVITIFTTENLEIVFETFSNYRKYKNLQHNKNVALVIGWDEKITVQYEGIAEELSGEQLETLKSKYFEKYQARKDWDNLPNMVWFKVTPRWIRYLDNNTRPRTTHEISL
jgi:general stress protein 26